MMISNLLLITLGMRLKEKVMAIVSFLKSFILYVLNLT